MRPTNTDIMDKLDETNKKVDEVSTKADAARGLAQAAKTRADQCFVELAGTLEKPGLVHKVNEAVELIKRVKGAAWFMSGSIFIALITDVLLRVLHR